MTDEDPTILSNDTQFHNGTAHTMPDALASLLDAEELLIRNISIKGTFFIEVMAGECIITLGVLMERVPCLKPWDLIYGEAWNVLTRGEILLELERKRRIDVFLGIPC